MKGGRERGQRESPAIKEYSTRIQNDLERKKREAANNAFERMVQWLLVSLLMHFFYLLLWAARSEPLI